METWIIVLIVLVAVLVLVLTIDSAIKCGAKRKPHRKRKVRTTEQPSNVAVPNIQFYDPAYANVVVDVERPGDVFIVPREFTPVHGVNPPSHTYPAVSYDNAAWDKKYAKQMPYNPEYQNQARYY